MTNSSQDDRPRLLVIGASILQIPALIKAHELGYRVATVDRDPEAVGVEIADDFFEVSTVDSDGILDIARQYRPAGILTLGTDRPMRAVSTVCETLGLCGPSPAAAFAATDKGEMSRVFAQHNVPAPQSIVANRSSDLATVVNHWDLPIILKPVDSSGSRGVVLVKSWDHLPDAFDYSASFSTNGQVIAQEFLRGREVSVEGFCLGDEIHLVTITDKVTTGAPYFVEAGHAQPTTLDDESAAQVRETAAHAARALGLRNCAIHVEIMVTATGPRVIELGPRLGGDFITSHLVPLSTGVDMVGSLIQLSCGQVPDLRPSRAAASAIRYLPSGDYSTMNETQIARARGVAGVTSVEVFKTSAPAGELRSSADRAGHVIAAGDSPDNAVAACEQALEILCGNRRTTAAAP